MSAPVTAAATQPAVIPLLRPGLAVAGGAPDIATDAAEAAWMPPLPRVTQQRRREVRVLLAEDLEQVARHVREVLSASERIRVVEVVNEASSVLDRISDVAPDVLVVDALMHRGRGGCEVVRQVRAAGLSIPIIVSTVPDKQLAIGPEMGTVEVVTLPFTDGTLERTIERVHKAFRGDDPPPVTGSFVLHSGKGGVGKTTIARNLAAYISRLSEASVILVDGAIQSADLRILLQAPENAPSMLQLPVASVTEADLQSALWHEPDGLDVLLAPPTLEGAELVTATDVGGLVALLRRLYDVVIVDTPVAIDDMTLALFDGADVIVHVVTGDRLAIDSARRNMHALAAAGYARERMETVLNRFDAQGLDAKTITAALGQPPCVRLPSEPRLAVIEHETHIPIVFADPAAPMSRGIAALANHLVVDRRLARPTRQP